MSVVKAGMPLCTLRIGRFGTVKSSVPSWVPQMGSCSLPSSWNALSLIQTFCANSNWRTRSAQMMNAAMPRSDAVVGRPVGQCGTVGGAASDHPATVHVVRGVARVEPPRVRTQRTCIAEGVHLLVVVVVVAHGICAQLGVVLVGCQHQRGPAAPAAHELGGQQLLVVRRFGVLAKVVTELCRRAPAGGGTP